MVFMVADMEVNLVADMRVYLSADMEVDMVADMEVDNVADMVADMEVDMVADIIHSKSEDSGIYYPAKNLNFPQKCHKMAKKDPKWPKVAQI